MLSLIYGHSVIFATFFPLEKVPVMYISSEIHIPPLFYESYFTTKTSGFLTGWRVSEGGGEQRIYFCLFGAQIMSKTRSPLRFFEFLKALIKLFSIMYLGNTKKLFKWVQNIILLLCIKHDIAIMYKT